MGAVGSQHALHGDGEHLLVLSKASQKRVGSGSPSNVTPVCVLDWQPLAVCSLFSLVLLFNFNSINPSAPLLFKSSLENMFIDSGGRNIHRWLPHVPDPGSNPQPFRV